MTYIITYATESQAYINKTCKNTKPTINYVAFRP